MKVTTPGGLKQTAGSFAFVTSVKTGGFTLIHSKSFAPPHPANGIFNQKNKLRRAHTPTHTQGLNEIAHRLTLRCNLARASIAIESSSWHVQSRCCHFCVLAQYLGIDSVQSLSVSACVFSYSHV